MLDSLDGTVLLILSVIPCLKDSHTSSAVELLLIMLIVACEIFSQSVFICSKLAVVYLYILLRCF